MPARPLPFLAVALAGLLGAACGQTEPTKGDTEMLPQRPKGTIDTSMTGETFHAGGARAAASGAVRSPGS